MKQLHSYIATLAVSASVLLGAVACDDNFERPPMVVPTTDLKANVSILDFKTRYWQNDKNYVATPGYFNREELEDIVIKGRVCSSNESGNIYNNIIISDGTAAITIAVRTGDLTSAPLFGQEVLVDVTGLQVGGYNGLMQLGAEGTYNGSPSMTFMAADVLEAHMGINGLPNAALVDTTAVTIPDLEAAKADSEGLILWQSRLIRIDNVSFVDAGQKFNTATSTVDRYVTDEDGNRMNLRISNYADFARETIPSGRGSVTGILSYYGSNWQLLLIDIDGLQGFDPVDDNPDEPVQPGEGLPEGDGTVEKPYNATQAIALAATNGESTDSKVYVAGYIVSGSIDTGYGNATWEIADVKGGSTTFKIFRAYDFNGAKFTDANKVKVGDCVVFYGSVINYMGNTPEMTQGGYVYSINGETSDTPETPEPGDEPTDVGSADEPLSVAEAYDICIANGESSSTEYYVGGYVISGSIETQFGNATFIIGDDKEGTGSTITCFRIKSFDNEKFTDADQVKTGDFIVVKAPLINYKGDTPETNYGYLISVNGNKE